MPAYQQAQHLQEFVDEVFEISKGVWAAQSKAKGRDQAEISETEFLALDLLVKEQPQNVGDLQRKIGVLPAQMSRVIRSLESKGEKALIKCAINPEDKRKIDVELTDAGRAAHGAYRRTKLGSIQKMLECLSEADRNEFMRILRLITSSYRNMSQDK